MATVRLQISAELDDLARRQHGVLTHAQLAGFGLTSAAIRHRAESGRLHRIWRGVYAVGRPELSAHGRWMAAVLRCGDVAALSHTSAAALWRLGCDVHTTIEVSVPAGVRRSCSGIRVHRRTDSAITDVTRHLNIPVTSVVRTLMDLGSVLSLARLERAVNEADRRDLIDPVSLLREVERRSGQRGAAPLRRLLDRRRFRLTDSELERRFLAVVDGAGLPRPETRRIVNGFRVDFYWPKTGLVVETDGLRYHRTPGQQARDRLRDQAHVAAGLTPLRFTHEQVRYQPRQVQATLTVVMRRLLHSSGT